VVSLILAACAGATAPAPAASAPADETTATRGQTTTTRLRQYFPETLLWMPEVETDDQGRARISLPVADSITTWRISVLASDAEGNLGSAQTPMRVFQEFFVEPDLPRFLTVGDEIDVPVSLYNYLDEPQTVKISAARADWFELRGDAVQTVTLAANQVAAAYIPIRVLEHGLHDFQVTAKGDAMSDAVLRQVEVLPNGQQAFDVLNGRLEPEQTLDIHVPADAVPGASHLTVKLYPGIISQIVDGLEGLLHQPYGCFEQTSSATYPNVLVLDYLRTTGRNNPAAELAAQYYINAGYQRLLTFEVPGSPGGFSLFGDPPPATMLTAYGLMEMSDMSRVSYVDPAVLERMATFLMERQNADGSWTPQDMTVSGPGDGGTLAATAYIAWALADAGYAQSEPVTHALSYLDANTPIAESDSYVLALVANAYAAAPEAAPASAHLVLNTLAGRAAPLLATGTPQDQPASSAKESVRWDTAYSTWLRSYGDAANLETTALAAHALLRAHYRLDLAEQAIAFIISQRNAFGAYETTQATIISLKTLLLAARMSDQGATQAAPATITITLDNGRSQTVTVDHQNADVVQHVSFNDLSAGDHTLQITVAGDRPIQYQVVTGYYQPWTRRPEPPKEKPMRLDVAYDRTELRVNDMVRVKATLELLRPGVAGTVLVDLGIPPGFSPVAADLDALVEQGLVDRYELTGRQLIFYLTNVPSGQVYTLSYRLLARYPIRAQTPPSVAYDYYTPDTSDDETPERIIVTLGTPTGSRR
ncbi:MAG TPA: alpha-2-macroglobulin family protein, partial [Caldilineaceae bacterium]|nr:alpha-2-macroglobulin family protein [Caldilineaceae bacterium]